VLDLLIAGDADLRFGRDRVDVRGVGRERQIRAGLRGLVDQLLDQEVRAVGPFDREHAGQRVEPFARFLRIGVVFHRIHRSSSMRQSRCCGDDGVVSTSRYGLVVRCARRAGASS
jgi:hypothetical protein